MHNLEIDKRDDDIIVHLIKTKVSRYITNTPPVQKTKKKTKKIQVKPKRVKTTEGVKRGGNTPVENLGKSSAFKKGTGVTREKQLKIRKTENNFFKDPKDRKKEPEKEEERRVLVMDNFH